MLVHHRTLRPARSSGVARRATAPAQTRRDTWAISPRLEAVLVVAWWARTAIGLDDVAGVEVVRLSMLSMSILLKRPGRAPSPVRPVTRR
jgi:hypothetical protein